MKPYIFQSLDEAQHSLLSTLLGEGEQVCPRGMSTLEIRAASFTIANPRNRCITSPERRWNMALAIGELCWHLSASEAVDTLSYYAPAWKKYADEKGNVRGSCYGRKGFGKVDGSSPWNLTLGLLKADPSTRRAVIYFSDSISHLDLTCNDAACASSLQFMIRESRLEAFVSMRSNDAIWGLPYDVFLFTFLQEMMARELGLELGPYHHYASSLHLYERHFSLAKRIINADSVKAFPMPPIGDLSELPRFLTAEEEVRESGHYFEAASLSPYWRELLTVLLLFHNSKLVGWQQACSENPGPLPYPEVLAPLIQARVGH